MNIKHLLFGFIAFTALCSCAAKQESRDSETLIIKVAVVYEDMPLFDGQRIHEAIKTPGYDFSWNNPREQVKEYIEAINEASHGAVKYEVVKIIEADRFFTHLKDTPEGELVSNEQMAKMLKLPKWGREIEANVKYDYNAMIQYYGFDKMRDNGEISEVWVYSTPLSGAYESHLMGEGAFWLNSPGETETTCKELLTVMFFNYERNIACALESFSHRVESTMMKVYGWWDFDNKNTKSELTTWERYTGYAQRYDKFDPGMSNIGNVHFPPNGTHDYDFVNPTEVMTYADEWLNYPDVPETNARPISAAEWGTHTGYMKWWLGHIPHFKGINPADGKLCNWWHYVVDYNAAVSLEKSLAQ